MQVLCQRTIQLKWRRPPCMDRCDGTLMSMEAPPQVKKGQMVKQ